VRRDQQKKGIGARLYLLPHSGNVAIRRFHS
jgi:hypothetical protein